MEMSACRQALDSLLMNVIVTWSICFAFRIECRLRRFCYETGWGSGWYANCNQGIITVHSEVLRFNSLFIITVHSPVISLDLGISSFKTGYLIFSKVRSIYRVNLRNFYRPKSSLLCEKLFFHEFFAVNFELIASPSLAKGWFYCIHGWYAF